jgi:hypothetical protein
VTEQLNRGKQKFTQEIIQFGPRAQIQGKPGESVETINIGPNSQTSKSLIPRKGRLDTKPNAAATSTRIPDHQIRKSLLSRPRLKPEISFDGVLAALSACHWSQLCDARDRSGA